MRLCVAIVLAGASVALGQADPAGRDGSRAARAREQVAAQPPRGERVEPGALRERLQRRLSDLEQWSDRVRRAIAALDAGATPGEVAAMAEPVGRRDAERAAETPSTAIERERVLAFLRRHGPEMADRIEEMLRREPAAGERILARIERQVREIQAEPDPELREIKIGEARGQWRLAEATRALAQAIRRGDGPERVETAREAVRVLLREQFDLRMRRQDRELSRLERRVGQLRKEREEMLGKRDESIDGRLQQIEQNASAEPESPRRGDRRRPEDEKKPDR